MTEPVQPLAISSSNCEHMVGASWKWIVRFAREHGVQTWRLGGRRFVDAAQLAAAMKRAASSAAPRTHADQVAQLQQEIIEDIRALGYTR